MRTINTTFNTFGASVLLLGYKGDSNATQILIDCGDALEEYEGTMAAMAITGPDEIVYPGDISLDEDGIVHWVVAARDCGKAGHGSARIDLVDDEGTVVASAEATTIIMKTNMQNIAPDQIADWTEAASVALQELKSALLDLYDGEDVSQANEAARQLAESGRVNAELLRVSAESARVAAESARVTAENARVTAENARDSAENARVSAENARVSAETARASAETSRVSEFSTIEANAQAALSYIGPSESSSTASATHKKGTYFIYDGKLYQATADIAAGDTITAGTNCAQVPGGAMGEVSDLKSALSDTNSIIADQLGESKVVNVSVAKGTTKKVILTFDLFKGRKVNINFSFESGINKSTYGYLYDSAGNNLLSSDSIGFPANTTSRSIVFTPSQDYPNAQILYTITSSASTDAVISVHITEMETLKEKVEDNYNRFKSSTELTYNIFDPFGKIYLNGVDCFVDGNTIKVEAKTADTYRYAYFLIERQSISKITVCPYTATGTGSAFIRIGGKSTPEGSETWIGNTVGAGSYGTFDVSSYNYIMVALYCVYGSGGSIGKYITYSNVMIVSGENVIDEYIPYRNNADYVLRKQINGSMYGEKVMTPESIDISDPDLWESGNINDQTGKEYAESKSFRTKKYIRVKEDDDIFIQAYYYTPDSTDESIKAKNKELMYSYVLKYDKDGAYIGRQSLSKSEPKSSHITGFRSSLTQSSDGRKCAYIRIVFYTYNVSGIDGWTPTLPTTIIFYTVNKNEEHFIPYYYDSYLTQKAQTIETYARAAGDDGVVFAFITDQHAPQYSIMRSPEVLHRLSKLVHIPIVFCGGDVDQNSTKTNIYCDLLRNNFFGEIHHAVGNHEFMHGNTGTNLYYDMDIYEKNQIGSRSHHYYYVDDPQLKIRYIVLAAYMESESTMGTGTGTAAQGGYTAEQIAWVRDVALDLPSGYQAIVFTHYFYMINITDTMDPETGKYIVTRKTPALSYGSDIIRLLESNQNVIAVFQGHTHQDWIVKGLDEVAGDLPFIISTSDKNTEYVIDSSTMRRDEYWEMNRASGTIYECAFDVVIINRKTKMIYSVRVGGLALDSYNASGEGTGVGDPVEVRSVSYDRS